MINVILSLSAFVIWWLPVYIGYHRRMPVLLASRTLIAVGITLMYCFPSIYFAFLKDVYVYPLMFYEYYTEALIMVNLAGLGFLLVTYLYKGKYEKAQFVYGDAFHFPKNRLIFIFGLFVVLGLLARAYDFKTGTLFFYFRSDHQFEFYQYHVLFDVAKELMFAGSYFFFALGYVYKKRKYKVIGISVWLSQLMFGFFTGDKFLVLVLTFQGFILLLLLGWRPKLFQGISLFAGCLFIIAIMISYNSRLSLYITSEYKLFNPDQTFKIYNEAYKDRKLQNYGFFTQAIARLMYVRDIAALYSVVPDYIPYQKGYSYRHFLYFLIPRPLWHNKPDMRDATEFMEIAIPGQAGSEPIPWIAEAFLNFSWQGTFFVGVFVAFFCLWVDYKLLPLFYSNNIIFKTLWAVSSLYFIWISQTLPRMATNFIKLLIIFKLVDILSRITLKRRNAL